MLVRRYGEPEVFELGELATPWPDPGEVLVRVRGSSVNPVDCGMRAGLMRSSVPLRPPAVLGVDVAGEVTEVGVGTYAIRVAKALGAEVTVTVSGAKAAVVRELGADHVIDYTTTDPFAVAAVGQDVVLNAARGAPLTRLGTLLRPGGVLVTLTGPPPERSPAGGPDLVPGHRTVVMIVSPAGQILDGLATMIEKGQVRPIVERTYAWGELAEAHRRVETGRVTGKIAIVPRREEGTSA